MRLELCIHCIIKGKENSQEKKGKVTVQTDIIARMARVTKGEVGVLWGPNRGAWASREELRAGSPRDS